VLRPQFSLKTIFLFTVLAALTCITWNVWHMPHPVPGNFPKGRIVTTYQDGNIYYTLWDDGTYDARMPRPGLPSVPAQDKPGDVQAVFSEGHANYTLHSGHRWECEYYKRAQR
jgi:hypothetical protein